MFTGIISHIGTISDIKELGDAIQLHISCPDIVALAEHGDSIAVNGVCLTVAEKTAEGFVADCMKQTLDVSSLGYVHVGDRVNLEPALRLGDRLGGHIVQGHVDTTAVLLKRTTTPHWDVLRFALPESVARYVVAQGSVCLNGTSLTVSHVGEGWFEVSLIPTTLAETTHGQLHEGESVNVEVDVLGKYVERLMQHGMTPVDHSCEEKDYGGQGE
ncbi:riboflavin synthase [Corynebacterium poyangense]|uniref:Riboflavin synthase n=1 Tax=Corynebacterium poyangense TaxID=2684405 RepID=A0A7H0SP10_9CORY|nr:riboflavin synthase [Corynebacterium poyangense]MBZ8177847.1 riboflavin synthase [Corynebacterium poyangense]QNQ90285.1 riboflavin synthase [Corynebacterium poyangense]